MINKKGQVSVEIIILVGMLIIGAIVLSVALINSYNKNISTSDDSLKKQSSIVDTFVTDYDQISSGSSTNPPSEEDPAFNITLVSPSNNGTYPPGAIPFEITYSNNQGQVTCSWTVNRQNAPDLANQRTFSGCNTTFNITTSGVYTANYIVKDDIKTIENGITFTVS